MAKWASDGMKPARARVCDQWRKITASRDDQMKSMRGKLNNRGRSAKEYRARISSSGAHAAL